jgi:hypothetical protein
MSEVASDMPHPPPDPDPARDGGGSDHLGDGGFPPGDDGRGRRRLKLVAPVATAAAVVLVAAGVLVLQRNAGTDAAGKPPPKLHLATAGGAEQTNARPPAGGPGAPGYRVDGTLPEGPSRGRVRRFGGGPAPKEAVARLATALDVSGTPVRRGAGWTVGGGGTVLWVTDEPGWRWSFVEGVRGTATSCKVVGGDYVCDETTYAPLYPAEGVPAEPPNAGGPVASAGSTPGAGSGAARPPKAGPPAPAPGPPMPGGPDMPVGVPMPPPGAAADLPRPAADRLRAAATPVLAALGLDRAPVRVETYPGQGQVMAAPVVDGLPTLGYETRLFYDTRARLVSGMGWLATPTASAEYPLVSARKALEQVPAVPELPCPAIEPPPPACKPRQLVIVAARPGLMLVWEASAGAESAGAESPGAGPAGARSAGARSAGAESAEAGSAGAESGTAMLVPAWLYSVRGDLPPLAAPAVDPRYLVPPPPPGRPGVPARAPPPPPVTGSAAPGQPASGAGGQPAPPPAPPPTR